MNVLMNSLLDIPMSVSVVWWLEGWAGGRKTQVQIPYSHKVHFVTVRLICLTGLL